MLAGPFISYLWAPYRFIHSAVIGVTAVSQLLWLGCPLVALESTLRRKYNPSYNFSGSFICDFLKRRFGIQVSPRVITAQLTIAVVVAVVILVKRP
jgi:hypothetical protein